MRAAAQTEQAARVGLVRGLVGETAVDALAQAPEQARGPVLALALAPVTVPGESRHLQSALRSLPHRHRHRPPGRPCSRSRKAP